MELFKKAIGGNEEKLVEKIEVLGLWTCLQSRKVLNNKQLEDCKTEKTVHKKIEKLLEFLVKLDDEHYEPWCQALEAMGQNGVLKQYFQKYREHAVNSDSATANDTAARRKRTASDADQSASQHAKKTAKCDDRYGDDNDDDDEFDLPLPDISVKTSTEEFYDQHHKEAYAMYRECRGIACIVNIFQVAGMDPRRGTDVDRDRLKELFQKLHFRVTVFNDEDCRTADEMLEIIKTAAAETVDGRQPQCFVLFVLSHGNVIDNQEVVFCPDGSHLTKQRIKNELSGTNSPNLHGVPRILFFQCCRGKVIGEADELDLPRRKTHPHLFVCYPCREGFASIRNPSRGSRFVQTIVKVFMAEAHDTDISTLMTHVNAGQREHISSRNEMHQNPVFESCFVKKFFFFPGIKRSQ